MKQLVIIGAGGHGKEVAFLTERLPEYELLGFLDDNKVGETVCGISVLGKIKDIQNMPAETCIAFGIANPNFKFEVYKKIIEKYCGSYEFPNLIDPTALIGINVEFGEGNIVMPYTTFTADIAIGGFNMINIGCTIGHDVKMKDFNALYPSVNVSGNVHIKSKSEIGVGSQIIQNIHIGEATIIGAGSVVLKDVKDSEKVVGVPGRVISGR
ncbi:acetyltransferase [Enterococcus sp. BWT-B8]|uniref:acetyltransferase n=1 Tax=Enterococcus sp. BWT-B8 TaxID=2885157 RepID=UPI001E5FFCA9|nr:acetyltransferase [Enterococcus sp. BWT-B8]MCB5951545.1 acetyltransferase [Enterococcus sp. BWT-B8]